MVSVLDLEIRRAIIHNLPIEENLHVIAVFSNPCEWKQRYQLTKEFIERMQYEKNVILYVVELAYGSQQHVVTDHENPRHLQLRCQIPLWHKENMINIGVKKLLPPDWKAFSWIDSDIEFEDANWAGNALRVLNGEKDIIQLFSCINMLDYNGKPSEKTDRKDKGRTEHPGMAWACTRTAYEKLEKLYDYNIVGGGDCFLFIAFFKNFLTTQAQDLDVHDEYDKKCKELKYGNLPGTIYHYFHGTLSNRSYVNRHSILKYYNFLPKKHLCYNDDGILVPTSSFPTGMAEEIMVYFRSRKEDFGKDFLEQN